MQRLLGGKNIESKVHCPQEFLLFACFYFVTIYVTKGPFRMDSNNQIMHRWRYCFYGVVYPERAAVSLSQIEHVSNVGTFSMEISCSIVSVLCEVKPDAETLDIVTLKNGVKTYASSILDAFGFANGCGYTLEINHVVDLKDNKRITFGVDYPGLYERYKEEGNNWFNRILICSLGEEGVYLHRALNDFREAINKPSDTAFFAYRSIESILCFFKDKFSLKDKRAEWEKLRECLNYKQADFAKLISSATSNRHGASVQLSESERTDYIKFVVEFIERFVSWRESKTTG